MQTRVDILQTKVGLCSRCYACVRKCSVKAIKLTESVLEIDDNRCIYCGACTLVCSQKAIFLTDDTVLMADLLASDRVVAVLAPEIDVAFPDISRSQLTAALRTLGFYAVEDMVISEELVATAYAEFLSRDSDRPIIRSTCPAIVNYIEMYQPEMLDFLAPIASPMIVQGRLIKRLYREQVKVAFIGPCIAKKVEAGRDSDSVVDYVITFDGLANLLETAKIKPADQPEEDIASPVIDRSNSAPGGFPIGLLTKHAADGYLAIARSVATTAQVLAEPSFMEGHRFFDFLSCRGCIDGPAFNTGNLAFRLAIMRQGIYKPQVRLDVKEITQLPDIDLTQGFKTRLTKKEKISLEQIVGALSSVGLTEKSQYLDCSICGYATCVDHARAVITGLSDWSACFPYQRQVFSKNMALLKETSNTDSLTGLMNHRGFIEAITGEFQRHVRYRTQLSVIMIDVDNFKQINDTYGHLQGDKVLKLLSQLIRRNLRDTDVAARYGGDEFAVILPEISKIEAATVAEKLRKKVSATVFWLGEEVKERITLSLGVCDLISSDTNPSAVIQRADKALYKAKQANRNKVIIAG